MIITGHSDTEFERFIDALGRANSLRGNYIILNSCETPVTRQIAERTTSTYGAVAAFVYEGTISASAVANVVESLAGTLKTNSQENLIDMLRRLTRDQGLTGVWAVSDVSSSVARVREYA